MKSIKTQVVYLLAILLFNNAVLSQTIETFNSRSGVETAQVKTFLQQHCWQFPGFETLNRQRSLEGNGCIISTQTNTVNRFYTPVLNVQDQLSLSFLYAFSGNTNGNQKIRIYLTDPNNEVFASLDSINGFVNLQDTVFHYNKTFSLQPGAFKLLLTYEHETPAPRLIVDALKTNVNPLYRSGCNTAPVAKNDIVIGNMNRTASGVLLGNDYDMNGEPLATYMISSCPDGSVDLNQDGHFTFTPHAGFSGGSTSFTYQVCDKGYNPLCSEIATVTLNFPQLSIFPLTIKEVHANYVDKSVVLKWTAAPEKNTDRFEIERSMDGTSFEKAGQVKAVGLANMKQDYFFNDNISENLVMKNDLYYRLKQIAVDGRSSYSKVLIVRVFKTRTLQTMSVIPNPAINDIRVNMQLKRDAYVVVKLKGNGGDELFRKSTKASLGESSITLEGTGIMKKGIYFLEVLVNSNERMIIKVIKT